MTIWPGICLKVVVDTAGIMGGVFAEKPPSIYFFATHMASGREWWYFKSVIPWAPRHWAVGPFRFL